MNDPTIDEAIAKMNWSDVSLAGMEWIEEGRDVVLHLLLPPSDRKVDLVCRWARNLVASLEFEEGTGGYALSWNAVIQRADDGSWKVAFDFAGTGEVSLTCQELKLVRVV